jgi:hypothetical protein
VVCGADLWWGVVTGCRGSGLAVVNGGIWQVLGCLIGCQRGVVAGCVLRGFKTSGGRR